jgi:hypothetical protein
MTVAWRLGEETPEAREARLGRLMAFARRLGREAKRRDKSTPEQRRKQEREAAEYAEWWQNYSGEYDYTQLPGL